MAAGLLASGLVLCLLRSSAGAEQKPASLPLPEMQRLAGLYVGHWEYTETYPKSAYYPSGGKNTGVYNSESGPGGNSIINQFHSQGPAGEFAGIVFMTWDPEEKAYKSYTLGDGFPGAVVGTGRWEGDVLVYRSQFSAGTTKVALRYATRFLAGGRISSDEFSSSNGAPETLLVHVEAVKK